MCKGISCPGCCYVHAFWSKLMKKWWSGGGWKSCVLCLNSGGQEKHGVTGTTLFLPTDSEYVMKSECEPGKNGRQGGVGGDEARSMCVSTGSSSFLLYPFTFLHHGAKRGEKGYLCCVHVCVTIYPHKRFCILSALFILPFIWTVLFSADHLMLCSRLSYVGKTHSNLISYGYVVRLNIINTCTSFLRK